LVKNIFFKRVPNRQHITTICFVYYENYETSATKLMILKFWKRMISKNTFIKCSKNNIWMECVFWNGNRFLILQENYKRKFETLWLWKFILKIIEIYIREEQNIQNETWSRKIGQYWFGGPECGTENRERQFLLFIFESVGNHCNTKKFTSW